jgi:HK97 family phage prohead protease
LRGEKMPDPKNYENEDDWMAACVPAVKEEGAEQDEAVAQCMNMWKERSAEGESETKAKPDDGEKEIRILPVSEFRFNDDEGKPKLEGYAAVFNKWSEDLGGFRERIKAGAFRGALKDSDVRALFNHDRNYVLGRSTSGTLELKEDKKGLHISNTPPETQWAKDLMVSVNRGDISQMSFGFTVSEDEWKEDKEGRVTRTIHGIDRLYDVSIVTEPAYPDTTVALRSLEKVKAELEEKEKPKFQIVEDPNETKDENEQRQTNITELKEISQKLNEYIEKNENTSETEPMQGEEENRESEGESETKDGKHSELMQGDDEIRDYWKNKIK